MAASNLILGTMNIIGDATNPFEFTPNPTDVNEAEFNAAQVQAAAAFQTLTIAAAKELLSPSSFLSEKIAAFVSSKEFDDAVEVATLCKTKKLDLGLDNKWVEGRLNAIVFALSPMPDGSAATQIEQASSAATAEAYQSKIMTWYEKEWASSDSSKPALNDQVASLLLWDLLCASSVAAAPAAFATMSKASYLLQPDGVTPTPREDLLRSIFGPLAEVKGKHPDCLIIIGCQEMPSGDQAPLLAALPPGCKTHNNLLPNSTITGFVYSESLEAGFEDVSEKARPELLAWLEANEVDQKIAETTINKMVVGTFQLPDTGKIAVMVLHCKSFKKLPELQGLFVAHAIRTIGVKFGCTAYCVGDMNIEAKFKPGTSAADQATAVRDAEKGLLPQANVKNSNKFGDALAVSGYQAFPKAGTITTLKMRMQFQGQPDKDGDLTAVHKDYVIIPAGTKERDWVVGGLKKTYETNMDLLQPSRQWPADHFAIFVVL